jgi:hypothetical protein
MQSFPLFSLWPCEIALWIGNRDSRPRRAFALLRTPVCPCTETIPDEQVHVGPVYLEYLQCVQAFAFRLCLLFSTVFAA